MTIGDIDSFVNIAYAEMIILVSFMGLGLDVISKFMIL